MTQAPEKRLMNGTRERWEIGCVQNIQFVPTFKWPFLSYYISKCNVK